MTLEVIFQQLPRHRVESIGHGTPEMIRDTVGTVPLEQPRAKIKQPRGGDIAAFLMDMGEVERLGVCGKARRERADTRGMAGPPKRGPAVAARRTSAALDGAGGDDGCVRDGQPTAGVEFQYE
jgi:hypothetical protein